MKVLIIEDDPEVVEIITLSFQVGWPEVTTITTRLGEEGIDLVETEHPGIILLDLGLPDISGFEVLRSIRLFSKIPVIIISVRNNESDVIKAFQWGADDYLIKPFRQFELLARLKAHIRRQTSVESELPFTVGIFTLYPISRKLIWDNREILLTDIESRILFHLLKNTGVIVSLTSLAETIWGDNEYFGANEAIRVHICHLREKIEENPSNPQYIITKTGIGYSMNIG
ncbi:chemotaxis protein CheY [Dehalococcoides mccartyi]|jgi:Response regulators consisting of a CheY-like receiver domain and a winged-helix DNA-binding domain|uniref:Chemotaxis protein CheY n=1 Tax=Dehalococcoides mccartyi TaxID=61435 RepID=A0A0V8M518_9CHLR|nr:response regulator transcription factor [Dehalococcoides mccartyi]KSV18854.1 chemotaxis protein CheY [Dehalococcoides mccartyi]